MPSISTRSSAVHDAMSGHASMCAASAACRSRDRRAQELERAVGEHDAEAEGGVGGVLLEHDDVVPRPRRLRASEQQAGGAGADDADAQGDGARGAVTATAKLCRAARVVQREDAEAPPAFAEPWIYYKDSGHMPNAATSYHRPRESGNQRR